MSSSTYQIGNQIVSKEEFFNRSDRDHNADDPFIFFILLIPFILIVIPALVRGGK